jgi:hypothetical protein
MLARVRSLFFFSSSLILKSVKVPQLAKGIFFLQDHGLSTKPWSLYKIMVFLQNTGFLRNLGFSRNTGFLQNYGFRRIYCFFIQNHWPLYKIVVPYTKLFFMIRNYFFVVQDYFFFYRIIFFLQNYFFIIECIFFCLVYNLPEKKVQADFKCY